MSKLASTQKTFSILASIAIIALAIFAWVNYDKFVNSIELAAKNTKLAQKPILSVGLGPTIHSYDSSSFHRSFIIKNYGSLPAFNVKVKFKNSYCLFDLKDKKEIKVFETLSDKDLIHSVNIPPNSDMVLLSDKFLLPLTPYAFQIVFSYSYDSEASRSRVYGKNTFVYDGQISGHWLAVSNDTNIFDPNKPEFRLFFNPTINNISVEYLPDVQ